MSELALKLIAENKAKRERGEDASYLDLGNCGLRELPDLSGMEWVETLILSTRWQEYDVEINDWVWFKSQNGGGSNIINKTPSTPPNWPQLRKLVACSLGISDGRFLGNLTGLTSLNLNFNKIHDISFLGKLTGLTTLSLGNDYRIIYQNHISNISFLGKLTGLTVLNLRYNQISDGRFLENLTGLTALYLGSNKISDWRFLESLTGLTALDLSDNQISDGRFLENLTELTRLGLRENQISDLPFLENLTGLTSLDLRSNHISDVRFLEKLTGLTTLELSGNQISDLEPLLPLIKKGIPVTLEEFEGDGIKLYENPLTNPPIEIVQQGNAAILRYFEDLEKEGEDQIYEAKLILIGEGGAGKTSLCRKLFDPAAPLPQEKERTRGIDIHPLYFDIPGKEGQPFRLNIWDFGGQGKYQSAHSFFYTHRSLYVLVDDTRTLNENEAWRALYNNWLQTAELFGGQSPVLVLHNEKDGCARLGFSLGGFQERFHFVYGELFRINLGGGEVEKITDLRRQIERRALALPHIGDTVPKTWVKVREAIETERERRPYISAERYRALCEEAGISDPLRQSDLSRYFHDLGVFLHFQDNPLLKRDVFLQNQWVTDAVYKILDDAQIVEAQRGRFDQSDLARLWSEGAYRERRDELLALMLQFELCYQVRDSETYVCPQLLPGDVPPYALDAGIPLQLKYEYGFMPKGLLYRLIVRLHRHIAEGQTAVWNSGVVLERQGARADIIESLDRRTISVRATGLRAKELVTIINEEVERLHEPFGERLKVAVKIPCNCRICKESIKPHFYDKADLDKRIERGKTSVECSESYDDVPVLGLLEGVFDKNTTRHINDKLKLFISYSKHDRQDYLEPLLRYLQPLVRGGWIEPWNDHQILPGEEWDKTIRQEIERADILLLLVSPHSLDTDYIWNVEIEAAMRRHEAGTARVVPVILSKCLWEEQDPSGAYIFPPAKLNALPAKGKPVSEWERREEAWHEVAQGVKRICVERKG
jgi:internalin A